ncbi:MAG: DUF4190 domain-containing protein [Actinomycetota bacterium]|nr:DUF4190 domain-containing protein [Actinomycetota bacterium]
MAAAPPTSGFAIASLVCSLLFFLGVTPILGIIFGFVARSRIRRAGGTKKGDGLAVNGIVLGFVELIVFVLLLAIAIPTFFGPRIQNNEPARASLENALTTAKVFYARFQNFNPSVQGNTALKTLAAVLHASEPQLNFLSTGGTLNPYTVVVSESAYASNYGERAGVLVSNAALFVAYSHAGKCWFILDIEVPPASGTIQGETSAGTFYASSSPVPAGGCTTAQAPTATGGWSNMFQ